ncbi:MAG: LacI family DNA-binding transcriptional regulator [Victivallales bacterium]|nr:LacI family DNA-binding transcriptional regulator [Victivallales bacterium]
MPKATLKEVSEEAGVSTALASVVLNNKQGRIIASAETRERIKLVAKRLGYEPNRTARALRFSRSFLIGAIAYNIDTSFVPEILAGIESSCLNTSYNVIIASCDNSESFLIRLDNFRRHGIDGLILVGYNPDLFGCDIQTLYRGKVAFIGFPSIYADYSSVCVSAEKIGKLAGESLLAHGHREIGYLRCIRDNGKLEGLLSAGVESAHCHLLEASNNFDSGVEVALEMLRTHPDITGVFADSDILGLAAMKAASLLGKSVPEELSVIGTDDSPFCRYSTPELSSIRQPRREQGQIATKLLMDLLDGKPPQNVVLDCEFIMRGSLSFAKTV